MSNPDSLAAARPAAAVTVTAVSVKLPEFLLDDPEMWFAQAEAPCVKRLSFPKAMGFSSFPDG
jgi:hypothetical protein